MGIIEVNFRPADRELRQFGFAALVVFGLVGGLIHWKKAVFGIGLRDAAHWISYAVWATAGLSALFSFAHPRANLPLYLGVSVATFPIGYVVSHVLMGLFFYGVLTPIGLVFRMMGRDPLQRRFEKQSSTYWVAHRVPDSTKRYFRQF